VVDLPDQRRRRHEQHDQCLDDRRDVDGDLGLACIVTPPALSEPYKSAASTTPPGLARPSRATVIASMP